MSESDTAQALLPGFPQPEEQIALPLAAPVAAASGPSFVRERDDQAEIYCARAAHKMLPSEALRAVLGGDVNNCNEQCNTCKGCYG
ncbi:MAG: hypothetical protein KIH67_002260 [Candidatus Moranbacteria bacterium]|nr:hypothetical protein [Candidatus Moranbacteria bacterium]